MGELHEEAPTTLGDELDAFLARLRVSTRRSPRTIEFYERSAKVWQPFRTKPVSGLRRRSVEDFITARAQKHPRSAKNELELLRRVLTDAKSRGQRVDAAVLEVPAIQHQARRGRALTIRELYALASWFPEHVSRLVLVAGQVGARQNFWFNLTEDLLDLRAETLTVPAELAKNRKEQRVYLTEIETQLLREQLLVRAGYAARVPDGHWQAVDARGIPRARLGAGGHRGGDGRSEVRSVHVPPAAPYRGFAHGVVRDEPCDSG
jgi:hypothetical protein